MSSSSAFTHLTPKDPDVSLSRSRRAELGLTAATLVMLFLVALLIPTGEWLKIAAQHESSFIDEIIFVFVAFSLLFPIFSALRWRELRREVNARAELAEQLEAGARINAQLSQMTNLLHSCFELEEASKVIAHFAHNLFPENGGALYVFKASRNLLERVVDWGEGEAHESMIAPQNCWALRQGQMYEVQDIARSVACSHVSHSHPYICLPMMAHGEVLALLHVHPKKDLESGKTTETQIALLRVFSEYIALALSNLKLRDTLRQQSIRDPLTGLFNRRYMEETLVIETERAKRKNEPFSVLMLDLDYFKRFNDTHGHDAGDAVLQALGRFLQQQMRGGDIVCRYGGEEFTIVMPSASLENAHKRAEQLRDRIKGLTVDFKGQPLGSLTLSVGVATFPMHGETAEIVLQRADVALYQAKHDGRDRVAIPTGN